MSWFEITMAIIPFIIYAIGWVQGFVRGKEAGINQELARKVKDL